LPHVFHHQVVLDCLEQADLDERREYWVLPQAPIANANRDGMKPSQPSFGWEGYAGTTKILDFNKAFFLFLIF